MVAVRGSLTPLIVSSMARCVGGLSATRLDIQGLILVNSDQSVNTSYVDGVSVTRGSPRQHIWTFAAGYDEQPSSLACMCVAGSTNENRIPSFVGQNYFCESGVTKWPEYPGDGDALWDGQGCGLTSSCCTFHSPPWFNVTLPSPTTDNIEVRICADGGSIHLKILQYNLWNCMSNELY